MQFLHPQFLWWLCLGIIPVALYLFRRKSRKVGVSTLVFFKTLAREHQESAWLRRLKKWLSFLITMLLLVATVLVLARLVVDHEALERHRSVVILLDRSASMAAADAAGRSRLDAGKAILRERLEQVPRDVAVALIAYDIRPEVLQPLTRERRELLATLDNVQARPIPDQREAAEAMARTMASLETPSVIWHVSDQVLRVPVEQAGEGEETAPAEEETEENGSTAQREPEVVEVNVPLPEVVNPAITAFQVKPVPLEHARYDVYAQVALNASAPGAAAFRLEFSIGGIPSQLREVELEPGQRQGFSFRINGARGQVLTARIVSEQDQFALDNVVSLELPEIRPVIAAWIRPDGSEDPFTRLALSAIQESGSFELLKGDPRVWPLKEQVDVVIFDSWLPEEWPGDVAALVINPPSDIGSVSVRKLDAPIPYDAVQTENESHPVLFRVSSGRIAVTQTSVLGDLHSLEPLWQVGREPVLAAGQVNGQRLVVMAFSPSRSERLPLTASFPLLMGNALFWCSEPVRRKTDGVTGQTGTLVPVSGETVTWTTWDGGESGRKSLPLASQVMELDRIGLWETDDGQKGAAHLLSARESDLPVRMADSASESEWRGAEGSWWGNLAWWLLGLVLLLLLLESWLFHRHAVY